jgi:pimeloyl-ACP methyl ester carboxylesterase
MIGHSMGGYVTLAFAEKYPAMLKAFGLVHSTAFPDTEEKIETRRKGIAFIEKNGAFEFLKTATPNLYSPETKEERPRVIEKQIESLRNFSGAALVRYYESMIRRPDRTSVLKTSKVPVLFILGKYDNAVPFNDGLRQCYLPPLSYIHALEHSGHMGMQEEPNATTEFVVYFLKNIQLQAR